MTAKINTTAAEVLSAILDKAADRARGYMADGEDAKNATAEVAYSLVPVEAEFGVLQFVAAELLRRVEPKKAEPKKARKSRNPKTHEDLEKLPVVRVSSPAGPCFKNRRLVRKNRTSYTVATKNGSGVMTDRVYSVHTEPCSRCTDHPETVYPFGYMD